MTTLLADITKVFHCASLGCTCGRFLAWLLAPVILCGIVCGQEKPKNYFWKGGPAKPVLRAEPKKPAKPKNYFFKRPQPVETTENYEDAPPVPQRQVHDAPDGQDDQPRRPAAHVVPQVTFTSFMRNAVEIYDELPEELGQEQPAEFQPIQLTGYVQTNCPPCKPFQAMVDADPRLKVNWITGKFPRRLNDGVEPAYPLLADEASKSVLFEEDEIADVDTIIAAVKLFRGELGLAMSAPEMPEIVVGEVPRDMCSWLSCRSDSNQWQFDNGDDTFTQKAFTVSIPKGMAIRGGKDKRGSRIDFVGSKPRIKANGFWHAWHSVQAVVDCRDRVLLILDWWQILALKKRG